MTDTTSPIAYLICACGHFAYPGTTDPDHPGHDEDGYCLECPCSVFHPSDDDGPFYCPHGVEVDTPGGACYRCALEDADGRGM